MNGHAREPTRTHAPRRRWPIAVLALAVSGATAVVVGSAVNSAEGRFAGSTSNHGSLLSAGAVELQLVSESPDDDLDRFELAIEADNVVPGQRIERCLVVGYRGSIDDVDLRLYARTDEVGLARFLQAEFDVGGGLDVDCADFRPAPLEPVSWSGSLSAFARSHDDFTSGLAVLDDTATETTATVRVRLTLDDDNRAQGLTTAFWLIFEVRP